MSPHWFLKLQENILLEDIYSSWKDFREENPSTSVVKMLLEDVAQRKRQNIYQV